MQALFHYSKKSSKTRESSRQPVGNEGVGLKFEKRPGSIPRDETLQRILIIFRLTGSSVFSRNVTFSHVCHKNALSTGAREAHKMEAQGFILRI